MAFSTVLHRYPKRFAHGSFWRPASRCLPGGEGGRLQNFVRHRHIPGELRRSEFGAGNGQRPFLSNTAFRTPNHSFKVVQYLQEGDQVILTSGDAGVGCIKLHQVASSCVQVASSCIKLRASCVHQYCLAALAALMRFCKHTSTFMFFYFSLAALKSFCKHVPP